MRRRGEYRPKRRPGEWELRFTRDASTIARLPCFGRAIRSGRVQALAMGRDVELRRVARDGTVPDEAAAVISPAPRLPDA